MKKMYFMFYNFTYHTKFYLYPTDIIFLYMENNYKTSLFQMTYNIIGLYFLWLTIYLLTFDRFNIKIIVTIYNFVH